MTRPVSLLPPQAGAYLPAPSVMGLSDAEQALVAGLSTKLTALSVDMIVRNAYYEGTQRLADLGISIPPQLTGVRTVVDWPRVVVDALVERCVVDGFRMPGATDVDEELQQHWQANDLDSEAQLCFLDALVFGRGYMIVGTPDRPGDSPLVTVESPLNLSMTWDPRTRKPTAAYQAYEVEGIFRAVLYTPNETISMSREDFGDGWTVDSRDEHGFGEVPVVRFTNNTRSAKREGASEITPAVMNTTDSACRSLLGMEIARELWSIPRVAVMGANESDFVDSSGNPKSGLGMTMSKMLAFERDEEGNVPALIQLTAYDPSVFTRVIDQHAKLMASYTGYPPSYFGQTTDANPASADAIRVSENRLVKRAERKHTEFSSRLEDVMRLVWRFANDGADLPPEMQRLETDWEPAATPTPAGTTDAIAKQVQVGSIPATSDVTLKQLGYSAVERQRLEIDRKVDVGAQILAELSTSLVAKQTRVNSSVANAINPDAARSTPVVTPDGSDVKPTAPTA